MLNLKSLLDVKPGFTIITSNFSLPTLATAIKEDTYTFYNPSSSVTSYTLTATDVAIHGQAIGNTTTIKLTPGNTISLRLSKLLSSPEIHAWVIVGGTSASLTQLSNMNNGTPYIYTGAAVTDGGGNATVFPVLPTGTSIIGGFGNSLSEPSVIVTSGLNNSASIRFQLRYNTNFALVSNHTFGYTLICSKGQ